MLRIEIGTLRKTIYLEHSPYESGVEIRIQFWNDHRPSAIGWREKPELQEISNDRKILAHDIIAESEWSDRTWSRYLYRDTTSLVLEENVLEDTMMKLGIGQPKARVHRTKMNASNDCFGSLWSQTIQLLDWKRLFGNNILGIVVDQRLSYQFLSYFRPFNAIQHNTIRGTDQSFRILRVMTPLKTTTFGWWQFCELFSKL